MPLRRDARGRLVHDALADPPLDKVASLAVLGGAPVGESYITAALSGTLTNERALAIVAGELTLADSGAGAAITAGLANAGPGATGPIGDATHVAAVTIDAKGRVTALSSVAIALPPSGGSWDFGLVTEGVSSQQDWGVL